MSVRKAAQQVLKDAGEPLHVKEIAKRILGQQLWRTEGKTPDATVAAQLHSDLKKNGTNSAFELAAPNTFKLRDGFIPSSIKPVASSTPTKDTLSFTESAIQVLTKSGGKKPMHRMNLCRICARAEAVRLPRTMTGTGTWTSLSAAG